MKEIKMDQKIILLVEDNPDDEFLTVRTLKKQNIMNEMFVTRDGAETLDYLFGTGKFKDRDLNIMPLVILLDLKLPKIDGLEVLKRIRTDKRTKSIPVVVFISSNEERKLFVNHKMELTSFVRKPVDFTLLAEAVRQLDLRWIIMREEDVLYESKTKTEEIFATTDDVSSTDITPTPESENVFGLSKINPRLTELISNLSNEEIEELLEKLEKQQKSKFDEKRRHQRKPTLIYVDCSGKNYTFTDFIQNISAGGIFIETQIPLLVDHELSMTFTLPGAEDSTKITGKVVRTDANGIAVRFDEPLPHL